MRTGDVGTEPAAVPAGPDLLEIQRFHLPGRRDHRSPGLQEVQEARIRLQRLEVHDHVAVLVTRSEDELRRRRGTHDPAQTLFPEGGEGRPGDPLSAPPTGHVAQEGDRSTESEVPPCVERVGSLVGRNGEGGLGQPFARRREIEAEHRRHRIESGDRPRQRVGALRLEEPLLDERTNDQLRLLDEDLGKSRRILDDVEVAPGHVGHRLHRALRGGNVRSDQHRRTGHVRVDVGLQQRPGRGLRISVGDDHHMAGSGVDLLEPRQRHLHRGRELGHVAVPQLPRGRLRRDLVPDQLHRKRPDRAAAVGELEDADQIERTERLDRGLRHPPAPVVALGHLATVDHQGQCPLQHLAVGRRIQLHRQRLGQG